MITSGLYGFVEGNYMGYSAPSYIDITTTSTGTRTDTHNFASLDTYQFLIGIGYKF